MIKINLLAQRKRSRSGDKGQQQLLLGLLIIIGAAVLAWLLVHRPLKAEVSSIKDASDEIAQQNASLQAKLKDEQAIKAAVQSLEKRKAAIAELQNARATPAYMLRELSRILTPSRMPTMTKQMAQRIETSLHRKLSLEWDPKHVWITSFSEKNGRFTLKGGAQSDSDVTQLAKRLEASVYFQDVVSLGGTEFTDAAAGVTYFNFTIVGKVVY
jgi:Tfp pilus assembly protein PilN